PPIAIRGSRRLCGWRSPDMSMNRIMDHAPTGGHTRPPAATMGAISNIGTSHHGHNAKGPATMIFEHKQKILFIDDSITDTGRRDANAPYGNGYMSLVRAMTIARYPYLGLRWENRGIGGDT